MPGVGVAGTTIADGPNNHYLRGQPPTSTAIQGGLSIFAAVVILRIGIRRWQSWRTHRRSQTDQNHTQPETPAFTWQDTHEKLQFARAEERQGWQDPYTDAPSNMNHKQHNVGGGGGGGIQDHTTFRNDEAAAHRGSLPVDQRYRPGTDGPVRYLISRPPPAPPLTPPELSSTVFTLGGRPYDGESLVNQPNPDYTSSASNSPESHAGTANTIRHARRLSYNKTVPIGIPISRQSSASESDLYFSSSSYPPTSPLLPPAPPAAGSVAHSDEDTSGRREIDLHGEIVGVLDANGAGWSRHTRVYGGGACMACAAAGRDHGEGGFYGPNVMPEEMR